MLESNAKFEEKVTCGLENGMKNLANWDFFGLFQPEQKMYELKIYKGVLSYDNEE